ncbi:MAG TPA: FAD-binding oxidoreductase [Steroidobacteraceae bacterium]|jgi:FAD/FMN-containing dehydrogenase|nr:FAD-binding oxidoreductase [Steroidobacteraceae bacterium]
MALPPNVTATDFNAALAAWRHSVGAEWVFTSDADIALYRDAYSPYWGEPEERLASAAVAPATLEQVQAVVRAANQYGIPLYPISTGRNLAYGGAAPVYSGSVVLDLKRMNRVLEVNGRNAYALVEPGVSYFDLYEHVTQAGLDVWIDPPDPGWGSVIGNALDGGGGWTASPFRDHFGAHCGMEVVLANGEVVRTGMGAVPNSKSWQHNRWGFGPWVDGLFRQSNFGVVTKMGFYLMPRPEVMWTATVTSARDEDIVPMLDVLNLLENAHVVNGSTQIFGGFGGNSSPWNIQVPIYGPEEVVRAQMHYAKTKFTAIADVKFVEGELFHTPLSPEAQARVRLVNFGIPNLSTFAMLGRSPGNPEPDGGHIGFSPIVPRTGESLLEFKKFYHDNLATVSGGENLGIIGPVYMTNWDRTLVCLIMFPIGRDKVRNAKMRRAFESWVHLAAERGWAEYRAPAAFQDLVASTYSYNDHALRRLRETIKDAVDPKGILSAGRYGVWPKHLRKV